MTTTNKATERLSRKLQRNGIQFWVGKSSNDKCGRYLLFQIGGMCTASLGWTLQEARDTVDRIVTEHLLTEKELNNVS